MIPIAFVHIEKAAGRTISQILRRSFGVNHCDIEPWLANSDFFSANDLARLHGSYPNLKSIAGHRVKPYSDLGSTVRYFTFLREPIERCASHYQYQVQKMGKQITFEKWINNERYNNLQTKKLAGIASLQAAISIIEQLSIFVGLIEAFDESLLMLKQLFGDEQLAIAYRKENVAQDTSIKNHLLQSQISRTELEQKNNIDIELYRYVKEFVYPKQKRHYEGNLESDLADFQSDNKLDRISLNYTFGLIKRNLLYKPALRVYRIQHNSQR